METKGEMTVLTVGDKFPAITVPVQQGVSALPAGETLNLGDTGGKWKIVFYWPKDFTFICPTEIIGYGDLKSDFADRDAVLIGASTDTDFVHFAWRKSDKRLANCDFRSEEHTSELQSLMRISYAVFCLKQKKNTPSQHTNQY